MAGTSIRQQEQEAAHVMAGLSPDVLGDRLRRARTRQGRSIRDLAEAARLSDRVAPEHLELCVEDPEALLPRVTHAGAIFLGHWTPEAIGDYVGGPNHVLPTARSARFSSGLSVMDFLKRTTIAKMTPAALAAIGPAAERLAVSESCLLYTSPSPRDRTRSRMPSSA